MPRPIALAATLLAALSPVAHAASTLTVDASTAILGVRAYAGVGVADANLPCVGLEFPDEVETCTVAGDLGSFEPLPGTAEPGLRSIAGEASAYAEDFLWAATMSLDWTSWHQHAWASSGADLVLSGGGGHQSTVYSLVGGPGIEPGDPGTRVVEVLNLHTLTFTLAETTTVTYASSWFGGYMPVQLARLDTTTGEFVGENNIPFSFTGTLEAGTYRLRNFHLLQRNFESEWNYGWDYSLTFHDTALAVPEAPPLAMLAAGLLAIGWRRARGTRPQA